MSDMPPPPPDDSGWSSQPPPFPEPPSQQPPPVPEPLSHTSGHSRKQARLGTGGTVELASAGDRLGARLIDLVIVTVTTLVVLFVVLVALEMGRGSDAISDDPAVLAVVAVFYAALLALLGVVVVGGFYEVTMTALSGRTLGKMAMKVRVVRADSGLVPGWGKSALRWLVPVMPYAVSWFIPFAVGQFNTLSNTLWLLPLLVYVSLTWDRARQGWHDKVAGTLVIKV